MNIFLANYTNVLSAVLLKKGQGRTVRECDETAKGAYEACVDEGRESCDVSLVIAGDKAVAKHACDCGQRLPFCPHKTALLGFVAGRKSVSAKTPVTKAARAKRSKAEALLEETGPDELKAWVKELLLCNKDLELAFVQRFGGRKTAYTKEEAEALTAEAAKSVIRIAPALNNRN